MPRVYEKRAGKDYPEIGVKKGETYYSWAFYRGPIRRSKDRPRASQLTQREELIAVNEAQEMADDMAWGEERGRDTLSDDIQDVITRLEEGRDAAQESSRTPSPRSRTPTLRSTT